MASWQNSSGKENHKSVFENTNYDRCIFCGGDRTEIARTDFTIMFSEFEFLQAAFARAAITLTPNKLKQFRFLEPFDLGRPNNFRGLITINDKKLISKQESGLKHNSQIIVNYS